jgi:hypothetical protein
MLVRRSRFLFDHASRSFAVFVTWSRPCPLVSDLARSWALAGDSLPIAASMYSRI